MVWLLTEILVFVAAAVVFGGLIGLGLAGSGTKRRAAVFQREHHGLIDRVQTYERSQRSIEAKAVARGAAEAAARGDLEARLIEMETAAADYRLRAEAAERRLRALQAPGDAPEAIEIDPPLPAANGADEAERMLRVQEIESLRAQLTLAEQVRARAEIDLAIAKARAADAPQAEADPSAAPGANENTAAGERPAGLPAPRGGRADDLRRIKGIGLKNEGVLNALGIYHYAQIAALTPANVAWLDAYLKFHGRIARDDWVGQARALTDLESAQADKVHPRDAGT